jgi:predicted pyridoxine 5'-phosphate oxidase superfamily flavin-nucleotide-binding protein
MAHTHRAAAVGFHPGELAVQQRAGVQAAAARLAPMVAGGELRPSAGAFLATVTFAAVTARDAAGRLWTSPLFGPPGFLRVATPTRVQIATTARVADPLRELPVDQPIGLVAMDFAKRRRLRINGILNGAGAGGMSVEVDQAYGNCPQYITPRIPRTSASSSPNIFHGNALRPQDIEFVQAADTFFLGTTHPDSGNDASHRGGPAGFVRAVSGQLWWPDFGGNNMFNSFGNLFVDPTAALLFVDFTRGATLQLSGTASLHWGGASDGRRVLFTPDELLAIGAAA